MIDPALPFSPWGLQHKQRDLSPSAIRKLKKKVYVLTDSPTFDDQRLLVHCDGLIRTLDGMSDQEIGNSAFYVYFVVDESCVAPLRKIMGCGGLYIPPIFADKTSYSRVMPHVAPSIQESHDRIGMLCGPYGLHENLCQAIEITKDVDGDFLELGVFTGSSSITAMTYMRNSGIKRKCWLMDTFEGFVYDEAAQSSDAIWSGTHLMEREVQLKYLSEKMAPTKQDYNLVVGNICADPLPAQLKKLALVNIDVDMYEATIAALNKVSPLVQKGGIILCEDCTSTPALYGAYVAMSEFMGTSEGKKYTKIFNKTHYLLLKTQFQ